MKNKCVVTISTLAAVISALMAFASWNYNKAITQAALSLSKVNVKNTIEPKKIVTKFDFVFQNTGNEELKINDLKLGHVDLDRKVYEQIGKKPVLYPIGGGTSFIYTTSFSKTLDSPVSKEDIPNAIGKHVLVLKLNYVGLIQKQHKEAKYFLKYEGGSSTPMLDVEEYKQIEEKLPEEMKQTF